VLDEIAIDTESLGYLLAGLLRPTGAHRIDEAALEEALARRERWSGVRSRKPSLMSRPSIWNVDRRI